jgi:hypothetical protein
MEIRREARSLARYERGVFGDSVGTRRRRGVGKKTQRRELCGKGRVWLLVTFGTAAP